MLLQQHLVTEGEGCSGEHLKLCTWWDGMKQWHEYNVELTFPTTWMGHTRSHSFPYKRMVFSRWNETLHLLGGGLILPTVVAHTFCAGTTAFSKMSLQMYWRNQRLLGYCCFFLFFYLGVGESHWLRGKDWTFWSKVMKKIMEQRRDGIGEQWLRYFGWNMFIAVWFCMTLLRHQHQYVNLFFLIRVIVCPFTKEMFSSPDFGLKFQALLDIFSSHREYGACTSRATSSQIWG